MKEDFNIDDLEDIISMTTTVFDHPQFGKCLERVATSALHNTQYHPFDLPSRELLDLETKEPFLQEWTNEHGEMAVRPNNQPTVICTHETKPFSMWFGPNNQARWIAEPTDSIKHPTSNKILGYVYSNPPKPVYKWQDGMEPPEISL